MIDAAVGCAGRHARRILFAALMLPILCRAHAVMAANKGYHVTAHLKPGGEGGWDYLTSEGQRLYYGRSTRVQILDEASGKLVGEVQDTPGIHGVAVATALGKGFTSNGRDSSVTIFDLKTFETLGRVKLDARNPDAIVYEPVSKRVFTFNGGTDNASAIDAVRGTLIGDVALWGRPAAAVVDGKGHVYVNIEDSSAVVRLDAATLQVEKRWSLAPGEEPTGIAIDVAHDRLFSGCANEKLVVSSLSTGQVVTTLPIGKFVDAAAFDPASGLVFSSNGEGTLTVIHEDDADHYTVVETVPTQRGARTMALDPKTHRVFLAAARYGETPPATPEHPRPRPPMLPDSFEVLVLGR